MGINPASFALVVSQSFEDKSTASAGFARYCFLHWTGTNGSARENCCLLRMIALLLAICMYNHPKDRRASFQLSCHGSLQVYYKSQDEEATHCLYIFAQLAESEGEEEISKENVRTCIDRRSSEMQKWGYPMLLSLQMRLQWQTGRDSDDRR